MIFINICNKGYNGKVIEFGVKVSYIYISLIVY